MEKEKLLKELKELQKSGDAEYAHGRADDILTDFLSSLGHQDIVDEWNEVDKWYA